MAQQLFARELALAQPPEVKAAVELRAQEGQEQLDNCFLRPEEQLTDRL